MNKTAIFRRLDAMSTMVKQEVSRRGENPLASVTAEQKKWILRYRTSTTPDQRWLYLLKNEVTPEWLLFVNVGIHADWSEEKAQEVYSQICEGFVSWRSKV